jgi:hypothetical protein
VRSARIDRCCSSRSACRAAKLRCGTAHALAWVHGMLQAQFDCLTTLKRGQACNDSRRRSCLHMITFDQCHGWHLTAQAHPKQPTLHQRLPRPPARQTSGTQTCNRSRCLMSIILDIACMNIIIQHGAWDRQCTALPPQMPPCSMVVRDSKQCRAYRLHSS